MKEIKSAHMLFSTKQTSKKDRLSLFVYHVIISEYDFSIRTSYLLSELFFQKDRGVLNLNSHRYMLQIFSCLPALCTWREHSNARLVSRFPVRSANFCGKTGQRLWDLTSDTKLILRSEKGSLRGGAHCQIIPLAIQRYKEKKGLVFAERGWKIWKQNWAQKEQNTGYSWQWCKSAFRTMLGKKTNIIIEKKNQTKTKNKITVQKDLCYRTERRSWCYTQLS